MITEFTCSCGTKNKIDLYKVLTGQKAVCGKCGATIGEFSGKVNGRIGKLTLGTTFKVGRRRGECPDDEGSGT